jgi:CDP-diacylglycerol--serine O-phosphatidyltransferase
MQIIRRNFITAAYLIILGVVMDGFDGTIARLTKTESLFGMHLDSLVDAITFGLVPAVLIYIWGFQAINVQFGKIISFIFLSAGVIRLARFNVYKEADAFPPNIFIGLPIPIAAMSIISVVLYFEVPPTEKIYTTLFTVFIFIIAFLMISNIKYRTLKKIKAKYSLLVLFVLATIIAFSILYPSHTIPLLSFLYLISPIFFWFFNKLKRKKKTSVETSSG